MEWYVVMALLAVVLLLQLAALLRGGKKEDNTKQEETERRLREELRQTRQELADKQEKTAQQQAEHQQRVERLLLEQQKEMLRQENENKEQLYRSLSAQSDRLNTTLTEVVSKLQESNEKKLDQMRETVDEKLQSTLATRLDASFKTVGEQLQNVYQSLGEMKELATGVSDLQRVLTNVKARGTWAEVQLGNILEQTLTADQFARNVSIKNNGEMVEYAIRIPSRDKEGTYVWLPIDSKFPQEDYVRLCDAAERADKDGVELAGKALEARLKKEAQTIASLYIDVPQTTDFAILFLPTEGLYAEVLRRAGLAEELQNKYRVMICGPMTITAFLNTLRMGFRTIALDKRAAEVWKILGAAKTQYENFETVLAKAKKKIDEAGNTLEDAQHRNAIIRRKLKQVEELEVGEADDVLALAAGVMTDDAADDLAE